MLAATGAGDGPITRIAWGDRSGYHWKAYVCREHLPAFVHERLLDEDVAVLWRGRDSAWDRECDMCVRTQAKHRISWRDAGEFAHGLRVAGQSSLHGIVAAAALGTCAWIALGELLPNLSPGEGLALGVVIAAIGPTGVRKARAAVADMLPRVVELLPARAARPASPRRQREPAFDFGPPEWPRPQRSPSSSSRPRPAPRRIQKTDTPAARAATSGAVPARKVVPKKPDGTQRRQGSERAVDRNNRARPER